MAFGILRGRGGKTVGLVKTRRLAAMQKQQRVKAGMKPPVPNSRQPKWMSEPSKLMKMAMAMGEYRVAAEGATDPEAFDFNRGEYLLCKKRYEEALVVTKGSDTSV